MCPWHNHPQMKTGLSRDVQQMCIIKLKYLACQTPPQHENNLAYNERCLRMPIKCGEINVFPGGENESVTQAWFAHWCLTLFHLSCLLTFICHHHQSLVLQAELGVVREKGRFVKITGKVWIRVWNTMMTVGMTSLIVCISQNILRYHLRVAEALASQI